MIEDAKDLQDEPAALWFNALRSLRTEGVLAEPVYDFSATPMFISTAARKDAQMFPWCVSDFSLLDAIESGLVKIPRVPVEDDSDADSPVWRRLFPEHQPEDTPSRRTARGDRNRARRAVPQLRGDLRAVAR